MDKDIFFGSPNFIRIALVFMTVRQSCRIFLNRKSFGVHSVSGNEMTRYPEKILI